ncbi:tRNA pseudouridine synthase Pus10 [Hamiltosporidium tvaerminnensis]|uniref:tRNA pseudouridine(55) synthase n=1 Tax=Hamiltosporidium tvaerminnensis TaxID=1176355 RepID=A0A4Q9KS92_9MICR|nr:tRNA pseudouridine synthase Pus10 [Hamiltosporidium tvaerminnensis]
MTKKDFPSKYIYGLYSKFSRNISQTPMKINGKLLYEKSISDFCKSIAEHFKAKNVKFISCGREDANVRMVGKRPFLLEIEGGVYNEEKMNINLDKNIKIFDLVWMKDEIKFIIKNAEMNHYKVYRAMLFIKNLNIHNVESNIPPINLENDNQFSYNKAILNMKEKVETFAGNNENHISDEINSFIHSNENIVDFKQNILEIQQKTPLRVVHRRSNIFRTKYIELIKLEKLKNGFLIIDLISSAGAYIKEFVNGDFGRTKPSLSDFFNNYTDLVELDVLAVEECKIPEEFKLMNVFYECVFND